MLVFFFLPKWLNKQAGQQLLFDHLLVCSVTKILFEYELFTFHRFSLQQQSEDLLNIVCESHFKVG